MFFLFINFLDAAPTPNKLGDPLEFNIPAAGHFVYCEVTPPNPLEGKAPKITVILNEIINGTENTLIPTRDSSWKFMWIEASISRCHIRILSTVRIDTGNWEIRAGIDGETETKSVLIQGTYLLTEIKQVYH